MKIIQDILTIINNLWLPVGNLGFTRNSMPQIDSDKTEDFVRWLKNQGVNTTNVRVRPDVLRLTQNEVNKFKVFECMQKIRGGARMDPSFISNDRYVLDGSHRFVAHLNIDQKSPILVRRIAMDMQQLIKLANQYPGVRHRTVSDRKLEKRA